MIRFLNASASTARPTHAVKAALLVLAGVMAGPAAADVTVGIVLSVTGPGAAVGAAYRNTALLLPKTLGGKPVRYVILDDATDATTAAKAGRQMVSEEKVDVLVGSSGTPATMQLVQIAGETKTPLIALNPLSLPQDKLKWTFVVPQSVELMMSPVVERLKTQKVKTIGYIGFSDSWGDLVLQGLEKHAKPAGMKVVTSERYARADTSVTGQALKVLLAKPDAIVIGATSTAAALPQMTLVERGYKGPIYHSHGAVNREFIKVGGKLVEGGIAPTGPLTVAKELPESNPVKAVGTDFTKRYEAAYGDGSLSAFSGYVWDTYLLLDAAAKKVPADVAPGTSAFRERLRDALEATKGVVGTHGVYDLGAPDHSGLDNRASVLVRVENGVWRLVK